MICNLLRMWRSGCDCGADSESQAEQATKTDDLDTLSATQRLLEMAEEARAKAMAEKSGAAAAVTALTAIAKAFRQMGRAQRANDQDR
jgi:hypothetical protein